MDLPSPSNFRIAKVTESLLIISYLFLQEDELAKTLEIRLSPSGEDALTLPLKRVEWIGRGMFAIDIAAPPAKELFEKSDPRPFPAVINS